jgi:hypothetical protein
MVLVAVGFIAKFIVVFPPKKQNPAFAAFALSPPAAFDNNLKFVVALENLLNQTETVKSSVPKLIELLLPQSTSSSTPSNTSVPKLAELYPTPLINVPLLVFPLASFHTVPEPG